MLSRRRVLQGLAVTAAGSTGCAGYAIAEPYWTSVTRYRITPPGWPQDLHLRLAVVADIHACEPWMPAERVQEIALLTNALEPDATLLLGDYVAGRRLERFGTPVRHEAWARALSKLKAPLGVHAVLGNHDWWEDDDIQARRGGPVRARLALENAGIAVYENDAVRLEKSGQPFWLAGLGDQWAFLPKDKRSGGDYNGSYYTGVHDLPGTLAKAAGDAPIVLMAHEPDIFPEVPARVSLTISGHTHGGQIRIAGYAPRVPSRYGQRYVYGHIIEEQRHLVVSGGLGLSIWPVRLGSPPEIVVIELGSEVRVA